MATRDAPAAVLEALVAYFAAAIPSIAVLRGWPETDTALDLAARPVLAVMQAGAVEDNGNQVGSLGRVSSTTMRYRTGLVSIPLQLDLWAGTREGMDAAVLAVEAALSNDLPWRPYLYLTATAYDAQPFALI